MHMQTFCWDRLTYPQNLRLLWNIGIKKIIVVKALNNRIPHTFVMCVFKHFFLKDALSPSQIHQLQQWDSYNCVLWESWQNINKTLIDSWLVCQENMEVQQFISVICCFPPELMAVYPNAAILVKVMLILVLDGHHTLTFPRVNRNRCRWSDMNYSNICRLLEFLTCPELAWVLDCLGVCILSGTFNIYTPDW